MGAQGAPAATRHILSSPFPSSSLLPLPSRLPRLPPELLPGGFFDRDCWTRVVGSELFLVLLFFIAGSLCFAGVKRAAAAARIGARATPPVLVCQDMPPMKPQRKADTKQSLES